MSRLRNNILNGINTLINNLGTTAGTIISVITLISAGFTCGVFYNDYIKNIEILDLKKEHYLKLQELTSQGQIKDLEISHLQFKLEKDEKESKK